MKIKNLMRLLGALISLTLVAAACGSTASEIAEEATDAVDGDDDEAMEDEEAMEDDEAMEDNSHSDLSVAIVAPSASDDVAFTQSMIDSLSRLGVTPQVTDGTFVVEEAAAAIRAFAEDGTNVIIAHGTQYGGSLEEIAPEFPETSFIWGTSADNLGLDNVFAYFPAADQGGYVNGLIAGSLADGGQIGVVGPVEAGDAVAYINGFTLGAESVGASTSVVYTGSFSDVALATTTAQAHADNGVVAMTGTSQSAVGAVNIATANDLPWFGTQSNTEPWSSDLTVASQVYHWDVVLSDMFAMIEEGTLGGEVFEITLENGGLVMEYNDAFALDADIRAAADAAVEGIIAGDIATQ